MPITARARPNSPGDCRETPRPRSSFSIQACARHGPPPRDAPYDFLVQSPTWKLGPVSSAILRKQFDKTYVVVTFDNNGRAITLNFIVINGPEGWVISDVESPHDSLRLFLAQFRR